MKKWIGALCSGLAGVLSLVFLAMPALAFKKGYGDDYSGWKVLNDKWLGKADITAVSWYRIFAWILVVVAVVLILVAILQVLANLNIVKLPAIVDKVAKYAVIAVAVLSVLVVISTFGIRSEIKAAKYMSVGTGLWLLAIVNIAAAVCTNLFKKAE